MSTSKYLVLIGVIMCSISSSQGKEPRGEPVEGLRMEFNPVFSKTGHLEKVMVLLVNRGKEPIIVGTKDLRKDGIRLTWKRTIKTTKTEETSYGASSGAAKVRAAGRPVVEEKLAAYTLKPDTFVGYWVDVPKNIREKIARPGKTVTVTGVTTAKLGLLKAGLSGLKDRRVIGHLDIVLPRTKK